jgi:hypothetical protein
MNPDGRADPAPDGGELGRHHRPLAEVAQDDGGVGGTDRHRSERCVDVADADRGRVVGMATQAGAVAGGAGGGGIGEEGDVPRQRLADPARRAAVDAGGPDGGDEAAVVGGIGGEEGPLEFGGAHADGTPRHIGA